MKGILLKHGPVYGLEQVKQLATRKAVLPSKRLIDWLKNHGYDPTAIVIETLLDLEDGDYYKTDPLRNRPGTLADIYRVAYESEEWYVKFFLDEDSGQLAVNVWSCWPDAAH